MSRSIDKEITLTISPVVPNRNLTCDFGNGFVSLATRVTNTSIRCRTPDLRSQWDAIRNNQAELYSTISVYADGNLYTASSGFLFYGKFKLLCMSMIRAHRCNLRLQFIRARLLYVHGRILSSHSARRLYFLLRHSFVYLLGQYHWHLHNSRNMSL